MRLFADMETFERFPEFSALIIIVPDMNSSTVFQHFFYWFLIPSYVYVTYVVLHLA